MPLAWAGCESDDPPITPALDLGAADLGPGDDLGPRDLGEPDLGEGDLGAADLGESDSGAPDGGARVCPRNADDYFPDVTTRDTAVWPACVTDDGVWHQISPGVPGQVARARQYAALRELLFDATRDPSMADFLEARTQYVNTADPAAGLAVRVGRRADYHYEASAPPGTRCTDAGAVDAYPDLCVGPRVLEPLINGAFTAALSGTAASPRVEAARIEAGLLWFTYLSPLSESRDCTTSRNACDSAWVYAMGNEGFGGAGAGFVSYVEGVDALAAARLRDAALAFGCWRDLDSGPTATNLAMRERVFAQIDRAMLRGLAVYVGARARAVLSTAGAEREAHFVFARLLLGWLDRAARARSVSAADTLAAEAARTDAATFRGDVVALTLDATFPCP